MRHSKAPVLLMLVVMFVMSSLHPNTGLGAQSEDETAITSYAENVIIPEVTSSLDENGRPPFFRLTFQATAGIGPEDLPTPFTAYIESGAFTYRDSSGAWSELTPGTAIMVGTGEDFSVRNADRFARATLLVLALPGSCMKYVEASACMPFFLPYDHLCDNPCRPDVSNTLLYSDQDVRNRLLTARFTVTRMLVPAKQVVESLDLGGESDLIRLYVRVEAGSVVTINGDIYASGDEFVVEPDDVILVGEMGADLMVLRLAASLDPD